MSDPKKTRLYEKGWRYYPASDTNVARTFARIRRQQREAAEAAKQPVNVKPIRRQAK